MQATIARRVNDKRGAVRTGALLGIGLTTYAEILDGFTGRTGFSREDTIAHTGGTVVSFSRLRRIFWRSWLIFRIRAERLFFWFDKGCFIGRPIWLFVRLNRMFR
jgi:hypothetical protein